MGTTDKGKAVFVLNAGKSDSDITEDSTSFDYGSHFARTTEAYLSVSVNPTFVQNNLQYENSVSGSSLVNSANFMELRNTSYGGGISNDYADKIGNRIYPSNNTLTDYATNRDETHSFKVKVYDSAVTNSETNRKFVYSTTNYPATEEVGLDIENYDYFILLNPDTYVMGQDTLRPHFAKVTRIISFDEFGDGLEFSPAYPTEVSVNSKFEIYKGPAKTATDIVAVSYGLRGDTQTSTPKHDRVNYCSRPTWYFYKDRLDEKDQLDYMTKYNLTHLRWWNYGTTIGITEVDQHTQYQAGSGTVYFEMTSATDDLKLSVGMSIYNSNNIHLGNVKTIIALTNTFQLDYARIGITGTDSNFDIKIGKTLHNVVFRTEGKFGNTIHSLGKERMEATLVDANRTSDDSNSSNFHRWQNAFPKMHRHTANSDTVTPDTLDGNLTGPGKYITFEKANFKNNRIPLITDATLNQPRNKMSQLARFKILDNSGLQHLKVQEEADLVLESNIHNGTLNLIAFEGKATRDASNTSIIVMSDIRKGTEFRNILGNNDIIEVDGYQYAVASVAAQSGGKQSITIKDKKLKTANVWSGSAVAENFSEKTLYLPPYTSPFTSQSGVINTNLEPDTEYDYSTGRITMSEMTIEKEKTKLYNARWVNGTHNGHDNKIDYGDKNNKFLKMQDSDRVFYQRGTESASRFYYYTGGYAISDTVFRGIVEDVSSVSENGLTTYHVVGRDETSKLLSQTVTKNTTFMEDVVATSIPPLLNPTAIEDISSITVTGTSINWSGTASITPKRYGLVFNQAGELIGEVQSSASTSITLYDTNYSTPTTTTSLMYYHPYDSTWVNYVTGVKALSSNELHTTGISSFTSISEKGIGFDSGLKLDGTFGVSSASITTSLLNKTSNVGSYDENRTLGYDISSPTSNSVNDAIYAFTTGNENGVTITKNDIATISKETFDVVSINEKDENNTKLEIAPIFPVILGRLDSNTSDARGNCNMYLLNNGIDTGGFIHRLQDTFSGAGYYGPKETIRYWDLQRFQPGTIRRNYNSIYSNGTKPQMISGYGVGYGTTTDGTLVTPTVTNNSKPLAGSNTLEGWEHLDNFYTGTTSLIKSYPTVTTIAGNTIPSSSVEVDIAYSSFEQIDPRAETYELLAVGDAFPYSKLRHNNLGYHTKNYNEFGILLESDSSFTGSTTHQNYEGKTKQTLKNDNTFEASSIDSATQTTNQSRRFGVMRLVEATFDWHFNPIDYETLPKAENIPTVKYFDYVMMDATPIEETSTNTITVSATDATVSANTVTESVGDVFYTKDRIGSMSVDSFENDGDVGVLSNGFVANYKNNAWSTLNTEWSSSDNGGGNNLMDSSDSGSHDDLIKFSGNSQFMGVQPFRTFRTTDFNIDNLDSSIGGLNIKKDRFAGSKNIRFSHVWITTPGKITSNNFRWGYQLEDNNTSTDIFRPHNIILPIISEEMEGTWTDGTPPTYAREANLEDRRFSSQHYFSSDHIHMSRVMAGLYHREFSNSSSLPKRFKFATGITSNTTSTTAHIYDNCIGVFRGFKSGSSVTTRMGSVLTEDKTMSCPLEIDSDTNYSAYVTGNTSDIDQHSQNMMLQQYHVDGENAVIGQAYSDGDTTLYLNDVSMFLSSGSGFIGGVPFTWTGKNDGANTLTVPDLNADYAIGTTVSDVVSSLAMVGTKSKTPLLEQVPDLIPWANYLSQVIGGHQTNSNYYAPKLTHRDITSTQSTHNSQGDVVSAQMIVKPVFDVTDGSGGVSISGKEITFILGSTSKHAWLSYLPDLTGYYVVSEKMSGGKTIRNSKVPDTPVFIAKIAAHSITVDPTTSNTEVQMITLDTTFSSGNGTRYRLMRPSEITFDRVKDKIMFNTILTDNKGSDWRTGGERESEVDDSQTYGTSLEYSETIHYMYLLLDIDNAHGFIERRTGTTAIAPFSDLSDGDVLDFYVSDGATKGRRKMTLSKTIDIKEDGDETALTRTGLSFTFEGELNGNGVVSFGEVFELSLGRKPKLKNINKCHIGTTFTIGSQLEKEVENIVKMAGLEYNAARSFSNPTGNMISANNTTVDSGVLANGTSTTSGNFITVDTVDATTRFAEGDTVLHSNGIFIGTVSSVTATKITCTANLGTLVGTNTHLHREALTCIDAVTGISDGDVLYTHDGHLVGEVALAGVSGSTISLRNRYHAPAQNSELITINKKTFVTNLKFDNTNMYSAVNSLITKRGLDYKIKNGEFTTRNIEDTNSLRKYALSYKETNRLIKVGSNKSMFDKANKIVVIGDKVQYELEQPTKKQTRTVKVIDPTIKTRTDAETKAVRLMEVYSGETRKIDVELQKQGLELLEAGDIVRMNFPNHNIPIGDYMVFEIENVLAGTLKLKVGTFDKTIAERLSELSTRQSDDSTTLLGRDAVVLSAGKFLFDAIKLKDISFSYVITGSSNALSRNSNMGFDDIVGFTEEVGFEHSTVTKKSYQDKFYEQENY